MPTPSFLGRPRMSLVFFYWILHQVYFNLFRTAGRDRSSSWTLLSCTFYVWFFWDSFVNSRTCTSNAAQLYQRQLCFNLIFIFFFFESVLCFFIEFMSVTVWVLQKPLLSSQCYFSGQRIGLIRNRRPNRRVFNRIIRFSLLLLFL